MKTTRLALLALALSSCGSSPSFYCLSPGSACTELIAGFDTEAEAREWCGGASEVGEGTCGARTAALGSCELTIGDRSTITGYFATFGERTTDYARLTCESTGGVYSAP